jgi:hypothetical protein
MRRSGGTGVEVLTGGEAVDFSLALYQKPINRHSLKPKETRIAHRPRIGQFRTLRYESQHRMASGQE